MNRIKNNIFLFFASVVLIPHTCFSKTINYELVKIKKGNFTLNIPVYLSTKIIYIPKKVELKKDYYIGKYEVTNKLWTQCYKDKGCEKEAFFKSKAGVNNPSIKLNWHDAFQFSKWISKKTGDTYRLPTEEEWAYAAYMGNDSSDRKSDKEVTYDYGSRSEEALASKMTKPVGSINKNAWGMNDFYGNVWEWTLTCWYGSEENMLKKRTIKELNNPRACTTRITRGETRSHIPDFISDTYNGGCATLRPAANLGFRLVKEI
jgi:formylglycine-generating enzyme required for sulfatase activity